MWQILVSPPANGASNMALDEALMGHAAREGCWILRVYAWATPTISFGRNQSAARGYDREKVRAAMLSVVRRPTGGRAILHHREVTYSVVAPLAIASDLRESYLLINRLILDGLTALGVSAAMASPNHRELAPGLTPCFDHPSGGEVIADGRKLVGSAQWRSHEALLQHGSILVDDDQPMLTSLLHDPSPSPPPPAATLRELLGGAPSFLTVADALTGAVRARDPDAMMLVTTPALNASVAALERRYSDDAWTWRR